MFNVFLRIRSDSKEEINLSLSREGFPNSLMDEEGNFWNIFGEGASAEVEGVKLESVNNLVGYWFIFPAFFSNVTLYDGRIVDPEVNLESDDPNWLVSTKHIFYGSFKDGIKSIDKPEFINETGKSIIDHTLYGELDQNELVTVIRYNEITRIYPHRILEHHEIINDRINDLYFALSYCPLTGTSKVWNRKIGDEITEFGVSGLLLNNNLVLYDRNTDSNWSQILDVSINGPLMGVNADLFNTTEMKLNDALILGSNIEIIDPATGFEDLYHHSSYTNYKMDDIILFPISVNDNSIPSKERVIGVTVGDATKVYRFSDFK